MDAQPQDAQVMRALQGALSAAIRGVETPALSASIGHLLGRGKLIRPRLQLAVYAALTGKPSVPKAGLAAAIELVHTFTLIHDDLPCMDDASLRRGLPAVHAKFGEANAVLAGDALLNLAFLSLLQSAEGAGSEPRLQLIDCLARATHAVIEGQVLDIEAEGKELTVEQVKRIHSLKTASLIAAACEMGAIMAGAGEQDRLALRTFGHTMGVLFQAQDDLLSVQGDAASSGKTLSSDADKFKATLPKVLGLAGTLEYVNWLKARLQEELQQLKLLDPAPLLLIVEELTSR